jgi:hypothetical protein
MKRSRIDPLAMTLDEVKQRMVDEDSCCSQGVRVPCVCVCSVECPIHGSLCVGEHISESVWAAV